VLTVWLIRSFTIELAEHVAARRAPVRAARLDPPLRRRLGVGNATGLGMAPLLIRHPLLMNNWFLARETALARVRALRRAGPDAKAGFVTALESMMRDVENWRTADERQLAAIAGLAFDLEALAKAAPVLLDRSPLPWDAVYRFAEAQLSLEGQEACVALLLEPQGELVDDLAGGMSADEGAAFRIDGAMDCGALKARIERDYDWTRRYDFGPESANARFWYVSEEKLAVARDIAGLSRALQAEPAETPVAEFLARRPEWRHVVRRARIVAEHPYAEIRDNLIDAQMRPVDLLRSKLAFFGARNFDPRSDRWLRIALFAGEPLIEDVAA
jgi:hypothetical protein